MGAEAAAAAAVKELHEAVEETSESRSLPSLPHQDVIGEVQQEEVEEEGPRAASRKLKKQMWSTVKKDCYSPQSSKSIDHESIPRPALCGLSVATDYLLWIPRLALKLNPSPCHRNTHQKQTVSGADLLHVFFGKLQRLGKDMFVFFHFTEGWTRLSATGNGLPIHYRGCVTPHWVGQIAN